MAFKGKVHRGYPPKFRFDCVEGSADDSEGMKMRGPFNVQGRPHWLQRRYRYGMELSAGGRADGINVTEVRSTPMARSLMSAGS